jgi:hypothetical protein
MCTENSFSPVLHPQIEDLEDLGQSSLLWVSSPAVILIYMSQETNAVNGEKRGKPTIFTTSIGWHSQQYCLPMQENMSYLYLVHKNRSADWWQLPLKWVLVAIPHSCTGSSPHQLFQKEIDQQIPCRVHQSLQKKKKRGVHRTVLKSILMVRIFLQVYPSQIS